MGKLKQSSGHEKQTGAKANKKSLRKSKSNKRGLKPIKQAGAKARKKKDWPMLKMLRGHIMSHHTVAIAEGGRHHVVRGGRRPPLIMWCGSIFSIALRIFSCLWPPLVVLAIGLSLFHFLMDLSS